MPPSTPFAQEKEKTPPVSDSDRSLAHRSNSFGSRSPSESPDQPGSNATLRRHKHRECRDGETPLLAEGTSED